MKNQNEDLFFWCEQFTNKSVLDWPKPNVEWEEVDDQGGHQEHGAGQDGAHYVRYKTQLLLSLINNDY